MRLTCLPRSTAATSSACAALTAKAAVTTTAARQRANMLPPGIVARVVARIGAFNGFWQSAEPLTLSQRKHRFCVAVADLFHVLLGQIERLHDRDGGADVAPALFLVERTIGREQHVIRPEERQPANRRRARAASAVSP